MRIVCFSDTHTKHEEVFVPDGDILVFAGDMCGWGSLKSVSMFVKWLNLQPHSHKIIIGGNHDRCLENVERLQAKKEITDTGAIYLEHEPENIEGIKFFGSPYTPFFCNWAFNVRTDDELQRKWSQIPDDTEVLITHGPPRFMMDKNLYDENCGCRLLKERIKELKSLKVHIFGHIHSGYGEVHDSGVHYVNCCVADEDYKIQNPPIIVEI